MQSLQPDVGIKVEVEVVALGDTLHGRKVGT
jgi:hypothetical protein